MLMNVKFLFTLCERKAHSSLQRG